MTASHGATGGVYKNQGGIHRGLLIRDYYPFHVHEGELQPSIPTEIRFQRLPDPFGFGERIVRTIVAHV